MQTECKFPNDRAHCSLLGFSAAHHSIILCLDFVPEGSDADKWLVAVLEQIGSCVYLTQFPVSNAYRVNDLQPVTINLFRLSHKLCGDQLRRAPQISVILDNPKKQRNIRVTGKSCSKNSKIKG